MMEKIKLKLNSPITDEQWNLITDAELEHCNTIEFTTPSGKKVEYVKIKRCKDCAYGVSSEVINGLYRCLLKDAYKDGSYYCSLAEDAYEVNE